MQFQKCPNTLKLKKVQKRNFSSKILNYMHCGENYKYTNGNVRIVCIQLQN